MDGIVYNSSIEKNNKLWFLPVNHQLSWMNIDSEECFTIELDVPNNYSIKSVSNEIIDYGDSLIWCTQDGELLIRYYFENGYLVNYRIPPIRCFNWSAIAFVFEHNKSIGIVPRYSEKLIFFNPTKSIFEEYELDNNNFKNVDRGIRGCGYWNDKLCCIFENPNIAVIYDIIHKSCHEIKLEIDSDRFFSVYQENKYLYCNYLGGVACIDLENNECINNHINSDLKGYLIVTKNYYYVFPHTGNDIVQVRREDMKPQIFSDYPSDFKFNDINWAKFVNHAKGKDYIWLNNRSANYCFRINKKDEMIELYKPENFGEELFLMQDIKSNGIAVEKSNKYLKKFLEIVR